MSVDPRLNCASGICCQDQEARATKVELLCESGLSQQQAEMVAEWMENEKIVFLSLELAQAIKSIAFPDP